MKPVLQITIILLIIGLVCGGIFLAVENGMVDSLLQNGSEGNHFRESGSSSDANTAQINGNSFYRGEPPGVGRHGNGAGQREGTHGLPYGNWIELGTQAGKIAIITVVVTLIRRLIHLFKRRKVVTANSGS